MMFSSGHQLISLVFPQLKAQMETLLKGHTHLQSEFWVFFEELRPPPARPGQFEEAHWPEEAGGGSDGGDGVSLFSVGGAGGDGFEEVTLPELEEEEEGHKILPMSSRRQRRKLGTHRGYKVSEPLRLSHQYCPLWLVSVGRTDWSCVSITPRVQMFCPSIVIVHGNTCKSHLHFVEIIEISFLSENCRGSASSEYSCSD